MRFVIMGQIRQWLYFRWPGHACVPSGLANLATRRPEAGVPHLGEVVDGMAAASFAARGSSDFEHYDENREDHGDPDIGHLHLAEWGRSAPLILYVTH